MDGIYTIFKKYFEWELNMISNNGKIVRIKLRLKEKQVEIAIFWVMNKIIFD